MIRQATLAAVMALSLAAPAGAWTRPGHMVTASIAYDELRARDPAIIERMIALLRSHPDQGAFQVAAGRATGEDRTRRLFLQMSRWPDDVRGGAHDHPTWHYAQRPVVDPRSPPPSPPPEEIDGAALEAFALNIRVAADAKAPEADRAVALCWILHLVGDIHQPLHAAQQVSARFPGGDRGGGLQWVIDPQTGETISLHWFWDDAVNRLGEPEAAAARGGELAGRAPRRSFAELARPAEPGEFAAWQAESHALAGPLVYRPIQAGASAAEAIALPAAYVQSARTLAERRAALAAYRLADVLAWIMSRP